MNRSELLAHTGGLTVIRPPAPPVKPAPGQPGSLSSYVPALPEVFVAILDDGRILAFNGHVDLGTGIRTSLAQIVAEELDVPAARVTMVLGDTAATPNQGPTIASATIQISAAPLRCAAAQARHALLALAAERFGVDVERLNIDDGTISANGQTVTFAALVAARRIALTLDLNTRTKDPAHYRIVGRASTCPRRRPASSRSCTTCACRACCMAASSGRRMRATTAARSSARRWWTSIARR